MLNAVAATVERDWQIGDEGFRVLPRSNQLPASRHILKCLFLFGAPEVPSVERISGDRLDLFPIIADPFGPIVKPLFVLPGAVRTFHFQTGTSRGHDPRDRTRSGGPQRRAPCGHSYRPARTAYRPVRVPRQRR